MGRRGDINSQAFRLFIYGGVVGKLPLKVFEGILDLLLEDADANALDAALEILDSRLRQHSNELSTLSSRIERVLNSPVFVEGSANNHSNNSLLFRWNELANRLLDFDPAAGAKLAARCITNFANINSITAGFDPEPLIFLSKAVKNNPSVVWPAIAHRLEMQLKEIGTWHMLKWLRGDRLMHDEAAAGVDSIPPALVFEWVDIEVENRALIFAKYCPPIISRPNEPPTFARQMLERYGAIEQVRDSLHANNFSESWSGPASEHYRRKLITLDSHIEIEPNDNVRMWLKEHREQLEHSITREMERELRESEY